jgi:hypothetical protein
MNLAATIYPWFMRAPEIDDKQVMYRLIGLLIKEGDFILSIPKDSVACKYRLGDSLVSGKVC